MNSILWMMWSSVKIILYSSIFHPKITFRSNSLVSQNEERAPPTHSQFTPAPDLWHLLLTCLCECKSKCHNKTTFLLWIVKNDGFYTLLPTKLRGVYWSFHLLMKSCLLFIFHKKVYHVLIVRKKFLNLNFCWNFVWLSTSRSGHLWISTYVRIILNAQDFYVLIWK